MLYPLYFPDASSRPSLLCRYHSRLLVELLTYGVCASP